MSNFTQFAYYRFFEENQGEIPLSDKFTVSFSVSVPTITVNSWNPSTGVINYTVSGVIVSDNYQIRDGSNGGGLNGLAITFNNGNGTFTANSVNESSTMISPLQLILNGNVIGTYAF